MFNRLGCLFGRHHRSRGKAHRDGNRFVSVCVYCGKPMERHSKSDWRVTRQLRLEGPDAPGKGPLSE